MTKATERRILELASNDERIRDWFWDEDCLVFDLAPGYEFFPGPSKDDVFSTFSAVTVAEFKRNLLDVRKQLVGTGMQTHYAPTLEFGYRPSNKKTDLLIIACSATKMPVKPGQEVAALELYDGPSYKILRKHLAARASNGLGLDPQIVIVSALHGAIDPKTSIQTYDLKMTNDRAAYLDAFGSMWYLKALLAEQDWKRIHIACGQTYRAALPMRQLEAMPGVTIAHGGIGQQLRQLKLWLQHGKVN